MLVWAFCNSSGDSFAIAQNERSTDPMWHDWYKTLMETDGELKILLALLLRMPKSVPRGFIDIVAATKCPTGR